MQREEAAADEVDAKFDGNEEAGTKARGKKAAAAKKIDEKIAEKSETKPEVGGRTAGHH